MPRRAPRLSVALVAALALGACRDASDTTALGPDLTNPSADTTRAPVATDSAHWTFTGSPASPLSFNEAGWDVQVHSRDASTWDAPEPLTAHHGNDCGPHPGSHAITQWAQVVYRCRDHIMTALRTDGYGAIVLTPDRVLPMTDGKATVRFDLSTLRTSTRDWVTVWLVPWAEDLPVPASLFAPDLNGPPRRAIAIEMSTNGNFCATLYRNFVATELPCDDYHALGERLTPSATLRTTVEITIRDGRLRVGLPTLNLWSVDAPLPADALFTNAVVRFAHYSYTPGKCDGCSTGMTWHWDNVHLAPARPFTITRGSLRALRSTAPSAVRFAVPSRPGSVLRFTTIGRFAEVSFDDGATWRPAPSPAMARQSDPVRPVVMAVPEGTTTVYVRPAGLITWWPNRDDWIAQDFAVWSPPQ